MSVRVDPLDRAVLAGITSNPNMKTPTQHQIRLRALEAQVKGLVAERDALRLDCVRLRENAAGADLIRGLLENELSLFVDSRALKFLFPRMHKRASDLLHDLPKQP